MSSVKFMNTIGKLASVKRYSDFSMVNEESVLEHTAFVGMMSYFIAESLMKENKLEIDVKILLEKALMHDIDEVATGDIAMPVKYYSESLRSMIGEMEDEAVSFISEDLTGEKNLYLIWKNSKQGREGSIVSLCDCLAVLYKIHDEVVLRGNLTMRSISKVMSKNLPKRIQKIKSIYSIEGSEFLNEMQKECEKLINEIQGK